MEKANSNELKTFDQTFKVVSIFFAIAILLICFLPYVLTNFQFWKFGLADEPNEIGDTIGGILGPVIAIIVAALTFLAFWVQYKANEQQKSDLKTERFESKFYELLKFHMTNVDEMNIGNAVFKRKCFVHMFYELKLCYNIVLSYKGLLIQTHPASEEYSSIDEYDLAYKIFFLWYWRSFRNAVCPNIN
jgi:heme/copper-type cytochrome/quinol oxidase subunit 2